MKAWAWGSLVVALGSIGALIGCGNGSGGSGGNGGAGTTSSAQTASVTSTGGSDIDAGLECAMKATRADCFDCCETTFAAENAALLNHFVQACACAADAGPVPCAADPSCKTSCAAKTADQMCIDCVNKNAIDTNDACVQVGSAACTNDPNCAALLSCNSDFCRQKN